MIEFFVGKYSKRYNRREPALSMALREALQRYRWPGNIRELENVMKRFVILQDETLVLRDLQSGDRRSSPADLRTRRQRHGGCDGPSRGNLAAQEVHELDAVPAGSRDLTARLPAAPSLGEAARMAMVQAERDSDRPDASPGALESTEGGSAAGHQLQDPAQQDQRARHRSGVGAGLARSRFLE